MKTTKNPKKRVKPTKLKTKGYLKNHGHREENIQDTDSIDMVEKAHNIPSGELRQLLEEVT